MGAAYGRERERRAERLQPGELPPSLPAERSNLGSERSRERPETPGTPDCTASAAVSLACSSHRVRLLTSRAVTSHRRPPRRLPLGVTRGTATAAPGQPGGCGLGGTARPLPEPRAAPTAPPAPHRDVPGPRGPEAAMPALPVRGGSAAGEKGSGQRAGLGPLPGTGPVPRPRRQPHGLT